jgi:plasmid replication initiation protein
VIEQARQELNLKASLTFNSKPLREGRKTAGWFFEIKDNKPRKKKVAGSVELPEAAKQAEIAQWDSRLETAKTCWMQASLEQKTKWLDQMDSIGRSFAPANETEPRRAFLMCLVALLEPELPLLEVAR